jgi:hypothetical protein
VYQFEVLDPRLQCVLLPGIILTSERKINSPDLGGERIRAYSCGGNRPF